jgi:predicted small lipoprotein YifL
MPRRLVVVVVVVVVRVVALSACGASGPTPDQVIARHRPAAQARVDALAGVGRTLAGVPPVYEDRVELVGAVRFHDDGADRANAGLALAEDFADLARVDRDLPMRLEPVPFWEDALALLGKGTNASGGRPSADVAERALARFEAVRWLFVLRQIDYEPPILGEGARFRPGRWAGEVVAFDLDAGRPLGGFALAVASDANARVSYDAKAAPDQQRRQKESWLRANLRQAARAQLHARLAAVLPGATISD